MKAGNCKFVCVIALLVSLLLLLTGCDLESLLSLDFLGTREAPQEATLQPNPEDATYVYGEIGGNVVIIQKETIPEETEPVETEPEELWYQVRAQGGLNVRTGPSQDYPIVGNIPNGTMVCPLDWKNNWAYIEYPYTGWCSGDYLHLDSSSGEVDTSFYWFNEHVQLYDGPGYGYEEYCYADKGVYASVTEWDGDWARLVRDGWYIGWCKKEFLSSTDPYPIRDIYATLEHRQPKDQRLVGSWMFATGYVQGQEATAGALVLRADGTFTQSLDWYQNGGGFWYMPGDYDYRCWAGEYTFDGETLVLTYRGLYGSADLFEPNGPPMKTDAYWTGLYKQVVLKVTFVDGGFQVDAPGQIPVDGYTSEGSSKTLPTFYRMEDDEIVSDVLGKKLR